MHTLFALAAVSMLSGNPAAVPTSDPVYLAVCREVPERVFPRGVGMRIELLGALENGALMAVDLGTVATPEPIAKRIPGLEWHFLAPGGDAGRAERFGDARLVYGWNEPDEDGEAPGIGDDASLLVLGGCEFPGTIYATSALSFPAQHENPSPRDDRRVREEIATLGGARDVEVERVGDAVIARARIQPPPSVIEAAFQSWPAAMRDEMAKSMIQSADVFTVVHPDAREPITVGHHAGVHATTVRLSALVRVAGEDLAIVVSTHDSLEGAHGDQATVVNLRTAAWYTVTLMGYGC